MLPYHFVSCHVDRLVNSRPWELTFNHPVPPNPRTPFKGPRSYAKRSGVGLHVPTPRIIFRSLAWIVPGHEGVTPQ